MNELKHAARSDPELALPEKFVQSQTPQVNVQQISGALQVESTRLHLEERLKVLTM
jgi:hypothetical protein